MYANEDIEYVISKVFVCPISVHCSPRGNHSIILTILEHYINEVIQYLLLWVWFHSLNPLFLKYVHIDSSSFLLLNRNALYHYAVFVYPVSSYGEFDNGPQILWHSSYWEVRSVPYSEEAHAALWRGLFEGASWRDCSCL